MWFVVFVLRRPTRATPAAPLLPYTTLFPSGRRGFGFGQARARLGLAERGFLVALGLHDHRLLLALGLEDRRLAEALGLEDVGALLALGLHLLGHRIDQVARRGDVLEFDTVDLDAPGRSEEHTSELQSLMLISYAVSCLKKKTK